MLPLLFNPGYSQQSSRAKQSLPTQNEFSDPQGKAATIKSHMAIHLNSGHDIESVSQMQEAIESFGGVPGVKAVLCRPPLSSIKKPVKWDVVSFVNNVQYGEKGVRV